MIKACPKIIRKDSKIGSTKSFAALAKTRNPVKIKNRLRERRRRKKEIRLPHLLHKPRMALIFQIAM